MQPSMVVAGDPVHDLVLGLTPRAQAHVVEPLTISEPNEVSVTALSQQSPLRHIELSILKSDSSLQKSLLAY